MTHEDAVSGSIYLWLYEILGNIQDKIWVTAKRKQV